MDQHSERIEELKRMLPFYYEETGFEKVGFVLDNEVIQVVNYSGTEDGWLISPADAVQYGGIAFATWHTHPGHISNIGGEDYETFKQWPDLYHFIVGSDGVRCYKFDRTTGAILEINAL